jgi:hypothetical protein
VLPFPPRAELDGTSTTYTINPPLIRRLTMSTGYSTSVASSSRVEAVEMLPSIEEFRTWKAEQVVEFFGTYLKSVVEGLAGIIHPSSIRQKHVEKYVQKISH